MTPVKRPTMRWFSATVRRQLIWGVALVHAVMMSLFVYDLSQRQKEFLIESQTDQAVSLAHNLALISATPVLSSDFAGLQELTAAIGSYPGVVHAMVSLPNGKIVAHGDGQRRGQFVADFSQFDSAAGNQPRILVSSRALVDVAVPVVIGQDRIGWVRVGVAQSATAYKLAAITRSGLLYTLLAIVAGVLLAWWLAHHLTRRLDKLARVADAVSSGEVQLRATVAGSDELSHLARAFNFMLDVLAMQSAKENSLKTELQAEKELAQITLASIGDAVVTTNSAGHVTFLNAAAQSLTGWDALDAIGKPINDVFQLQINPSGTSLDNPVAQVLASGVAVTSTECSALLARGGSKCWVDSLASPIFAPNGRVLGCVLVFRDVSEKFVAQDRLQWQAGHDALTGLPNRMLLADRFSRALEKARRDGTQLAVCMLDLDKFKPVNDNFGHAVGDELLVVLSSRLGQELRAVDTLTRLGGDEFVILLEDLADSVDLSGLLSRILRSLAEPFEISGHHIAITGSLGLTVFPQDDSDPDTLLRHADQAMYVAKQTGRNRFHRFDVLQDRQLESEHQTQARVRQAMIDDELLLHYQPKVNLRSGEIEGFEALLRWQHPQNGMIPPLAFLPLIEQTDLISDIGQWVIERALAQLQQWQQQGAVWPVSVNIAARHFQKADFFDRLQVTLADYPEVSPTLLEFEILESAALADYHTMNELIASCKRLGIRFSLDDFGTGYSSLSYLKRLPVQTLKIDQSFVRDMLDDPDDRALVESVINIAKLFRLSVIAEGVESQDQGVLLLRLGCEVVQGYGIARPMPAEAVAGWARNYIPDAHWRRWADVPWELGDLPLLMAQRDHLVWIKRVLALTESSVVPPAEVKLLEQQPCRFGSWYSGHGAQRYGHLPEFQAIGMVHLRVHQLADEVLRLLAADESEQARAMAAQLTALKDEMLVLLGDLQRAALLALEMPQLHLSMTSSSE
jgi:diguanylate cyclase (GGDEF)-like protein/PAS domain S-box-containing protein